MLKPLDKRSYFRFLSLVVITLTFLPLFYNNLPPIIGSYRYVWAPIWILSLLIFYRQILKHKLIIYLLLYGLIFLVILLNSLWIHMREWDRNMITDEYYTFIVSISVITYFRICKDFNGLAWLSRLAVLFILITSVLSIFSSFIDPMYARNLIGNMYLTEEREYFSRLGCGTYGFATALVALFPMSIYYLRNNELIGLSKILIMAIIILFFFTLIRMQIFANILVATFSTIFSILGSKRIKRSVIISGIVLLIILLTPVSYYSRLLSSASRYFEPYSETYYKLNDLSSYLSDDYESDGTGTGGRMDRYPMLMNAFLINPFLGYYLTPEVNDIGSGGHLYWMNKLTILGIFGFVAFLLIHYIFIKSNLKYFNKEYLYYYVLSVISILILGLFKNLTGRETWFLYFVLLPGLFYLPLLMRKDK